MRSSDLIDRLAEIKRRKESQAVAEWDASLVEQVVVLWGPAGTGKTSSGVRYARRWQAMTGRPVVVVGTLIGIKQEYVDHTYLSPEDFVCQMRVISSMASDLEGVEDDDEKEIRLLNARGCPHPEHDPAYVHLANGQWKRAEHCSEKALEKATERGQECWTALNGVIIYRSIILLDEGNEFVGGDTAANPLVRLFTRFIQMRRHLRLTLLIMAPDPADIAPKTRRQVSTYGRCYTFKDGPFAANPYTKVVFEGGNLRRERTIRFSARPYWDMYESHNLLSIRGRNLNIASKFM